MVFAEVRDVNESDSTAARSAALRLLTHGRRSLPGVEVDSYSVELEFDEGLTGDQAAKGAFIRILDGLRWPLRAAGMDPLGTKPSAHISRKKLESTLADGAPEETAIVQGAVEEFAQQGLEAASMGGFHSKQLVLAAFSTRFRGARRILGKIPCPCDRHGAPRGAQRRAGHEDAPPARPARTRRRCMHRPRRGRRLVPLLEPLWR